MTDATRQVLERLGEAGFQIREGGISPFGEDLPLVTGVAWDRETAQIALVAHVDIDGNAHADAWRQLLFAASGLRHQLAGQGPPAFGTPLVVAIVDGDGERILRGLVEDLVNRYAVFSRVDLNLVREGDLADRDKLDTALAPLLPCCRALGDTAISRADVRRFWQALRDNIRTAAHELDAVFGTHRDVAALELGDALIATSDEDQELPSLSPVHWVGLSDFRSFEGGRLDLAQVTVLHGTNGSGKSSLLEALELLWAGTSQRRPAGVPAEHYAEHLPRGGSGTFEVRGQLVGEAEERVVDNVIDRPAAELARNVLTQESVDALVNAAPGERYEALLSVTGLEVPELEPRTRRLLDDAKSRADAALRAAGLPPLPRANARGLEHVRAALEVGLARRLGAADDVSAAARALEDASEGAYTASDWSLPDAVVATLLRADAEIEAIASSLSRRPSVAAALEEASDAVRAAATQRQAAARSLRRLLDVMAETSLEDRPGTPEIHVQPVPLPLAARWLAHTDSVRSSAAQFRVEAAELPDALWAARLSAYAEALEAAASGVPLQELERIARPPQPAVPKPQRAAPVIDDYISAGFTTAPPRPDRLTPLVAALHEQLERHAFALSTLAADIDAHPARQVAEHADAILASICRFELARHIRRRGPIMSASEDLLRELLRGRLYPVVRELVAAMVRFEWYFQPLEVTADGRQVLLGGLATPRSDLDARMLLNSAERTVLGVAWFLALHLLQPSDRRRVLVLDDPAGAFDPVNRAGFVATLRAFLRLIRPEQVVLATHDDMIATMLTEELSPAAGWPGATVRIRCQRDDRDASVFVPEAVPRSPGDLSDEEAMLGLGGEPTLFDIA